MVDRDLVAAKLSELVERVHRVRRHRTDSADELSRDQDRLDLVSFNLMLAVQLCLDVASHLIADEGWPMAQDITGSFVRLSERGVITAPVAEAMARAAGLRNVVAHVYGRVDPDLVYRAATIGLEDLERFAAEVSSWVEDRVATDRPEGPKKSMTIELEEADEAPPGEQEKGGR